MSFDQGSYWRERGESYVDEFARHSEETSAIFAKQEDELRAVLAKLDLGSVRSVIEVGCGFGRVTPILLGALPSDVDYLGIDISAGQVEHAARARPDLRFVVGNFTELDLRPVDLLFASEVFLHFPPDEIGAVLQRALDLAPIVIHVDPTAHPLRDRIRRALRRAAGWSWSHDYRRLVPRGASLQTFSILDDDQRVYVTTRAAGV